MAVTPLCILQLELGGTQQVKGMSVLTPVNACTQRQFGFPQDAVLSAGTA